MFNEKGSGVAPEKLNVVGYARVSTEEQSKGSSTESQIQYIQNVCIEKGWNYTKSYIDNGYSGGNEFRPALKQLVNDLDKNKFDILAITNTDRLSRDPDYAFALLKKCFTFDIGIYIFTFNTYGIIKNIDDPTISMMLRTFFTFDEFFRKLTIQKTKMGMKILKDKGHHLGRPPTFFKINKRSGKLVADDLDKLNEFREAVTPIPKKKPYGYYSRIANKIGLDYWSVYRAVQDYDKYKNIK